MVILQVGVKQSSRLTQVGRPYQLPPVPRGLDPDTVTSAPDWQEAVALASQQAKQPLALGAALVRAWRGVSPSLADELCSQAGVSDDALPGALAAEQWSALWEQWQGWLRRVVSCSFAASSCPSTGRISVLGSYSDSVPNVLEAWHEQYSRALEWEQFLQTRQRLQAGVSAATQRQQRKLEALHAQGGQEDKHLQTSKLADLLMANTYRLVGGWASWLQPGTSGTAASRGSPFGARVGLLHLISSLNWCRWRPGMQQLEGLEDWDAPGSIVSVNIDSGKNAIETATRLYKAAAKQRRAVTAVIPMIEECQQTQGYLEEVSGSALPSCPIVRNP